MTPRYRAWDKHEQKMFTNDELIIWNGNVYANDSKKLTCNNLKGWSIDDEYLMQSTGLVDKNGKEIFEGDILEIQGIRMVVKFGSYEYIESSKSNGHTLGVVYDGLGFYVECINAADPDRISPFEPKTLKESYVIGNRFETPELLEDKG
ncbi:YopX family protein [Streptococcus mitis]|uniref:YopX protein domain-containing protein n=1 Tax=Streptococcus mitis TaxID=28037 RepID=A0A1X1K283_STRMT|nr:YopX family protein [Streptococcus mitis]ORO93484.1 hypothetical protein B7698_08680 [Streptococcus mitis]